MMYPALYVGTTLVGLTAAAGGVHLYRKRNAASKGNVTPTKTKKQMPKANVQVTTTSASEQGLCSKCISKVRNVFLYLGPFAKTAATYTLYRVVPNAVGGAIAEGAAESAITFTREWLACPVFGDTSRACAAVAKNNRGGVGGARVWVRGAAVHAGVVMISDFVRLGISKATFGYFEPPMGDMQKQLNGSLERVDTLNEKINAQRQKTKALDDRISALENNAADPEKTDEGIKPDRYAAT